MATSRAKLKAVPVPVPVSKRPSATQVIEQMTQAQLECRDFGHMWSNQNTNVKQDSYSKLFHEIMLCPRCHTTKHRVINMRGELIDTSYRYAERRSRGYATGSGQDSTGEMTEEGENASRR